MKSETFKIISILVIIVLIIMNLLIAKNKDRIQLAKFSIDKKDDPRGFAIAVFMYWLILASTLVALVKEVDKILR